MRTARRAYAKVNLALAVGRAHPADGPHAGMHPIASWMHSIDLWDDVEIEPLPDGPSRHAIVWAPGAPRPSPIDWPPDKDLAVRAHRLVEREAARPLPAAVRITKRTPVGGGLGGGSSDASAALLALNEAFALGLPIARLADLSRELGSDVAYFLDTENPPRPAVVEGLGDQVRRVRPAAARLILVIPAFGCPTGAVYRAFDALPPRQWGGDRVGAMAGASSPHAAPLFNDLIDAACAVEPRMRGLIQQVAAAADRQPLMSGSGSTLFIPAQDDGSAAVISGKIRASVPDVTVVDVRLV